tara:strand:- start:338 stop:2431 length:2094 start_codon:yes stop_codon:yes gene_type:complete
MVLGMALVSGMGLQPPAVAQQADDAGATQKLAPVSITATRNPIKAFDYPGMVTVIGREEIDTSQPSTPDDLLKLVPNVEFTGGPRRTGELPSIRGFSGPDVVLLFDGARQNFGSAHDGRFFIDPSLLRSVEVLRGPASALYGSGGTGGIIEFRTLQAADLLRPGESVGGWVSTGYQSAADEKIGTFTAYGRPLEGLDLVASLSKRDSGAIQLGNGQELSTADDDVLSGLAKASYSFADHHRLEGSYLSFNNDAREPNNGQGLGDDNLVDKEIRSDTLRAAYSYNNPDNAWLDLDIVVHRNATTVDETRLDGNGAGPAGERLRRDVDSYGLRLDNRSHLTLSDSVALTLTYGGEYYRDEQDGAAGGAQRDGVPDAEASAAGVFAQAQLSLTEPLGLIPGDLLIIPGARFDDYQASSALAADNSDSAFSPRIGVSYLPREWLLTFANYAHAFRAPSFDELYLTGTHFQIPLGGATVVNRFVPNPDIKPQTTRTFEYGVGLTFDDAFVNNDLLQVKASRFDIRGEDFIDLQVIQPALFVACNPFVPGACDGTTRNVNVPRARLRGMEIEASYENHRGLLSLGYSKINGKNQDTGARLGVLTPDQFTLHAGLKLPEFDSIVGWRLLIADDFNKVNAATDARAGYDVHDIYLSWQPSQQLLRGARLDLGIDNLFDEAYSRTYTGAAEPGRNYKAAIRYGMNW